MAQERLPYLNEKAGAYTALGGLDAYVQGVGLDPPLLELVKVRASQLNGCSYCTDMHSKDALKAGVPQRQLLALSVWRHAQMLFDAPERAVLGLTEAVTLLPGGVSDEVLNAVKAHFSEEQTAGWVMAIIAINAWNRIGVTAAMQPA